MKVIKYWAKSMLMDTLVFGLFYLWQFKAIEGAGNALSFVLWALIILRMLASFQVNKETVAKNPRPPLFAQYHFLGEVVTIIALAWIGHIWTAGFYLLSTLMIEGARSIEPKQKKQSCESK